MSFNPLTRKNTSETPPAVSVGDRIACNPGRRTWPTLLIGEVIAMQSGRKGRLADVRVPGFGTVRLAIDQITIKVLAKEPAKVPVEVVC